MSIVGAKPNVGCWNKTECWSKTEHRKLFGKRLFSRKTAHHNSIPLCLSSQRADFAALARKASILKQSGDEAGRVFAKVLDKP
jgi:hypothetical protein